MFGALSGHEECKAWLAFHNCLIEEWNNEFRTFTQIMVGPCEGAGSTPSIYWEMESPYRSGHDVVGWLQAKRAMVHEAEELVRCHGLSWDRASMLATNQMVKDIDKDLQALAQQDWPSNWAETLEWQSMAKLDQLLYCTSWAQGCAKTCGGVFRLFLQHLEKRNPAFPLEVLEEAFDKLIMGASRKRKELGGPPP